MTDATVPVTQRTVEQFTESYLTSLGAQIEKNEGRWSVNLPDGADTNLELDRAVLEIVDDPSDIDEGALAIAPESPFVERMLEEVADRTPVGSMSLTGDHVDIRLPPWITAGPADITDQSFTPYYDRQAICTLFHVGIETVSEYQREVLRAVAIDLNDHDERPRLAETYLEIVDDDQREIDEGRPVDEQVLSDALETARSTIESELSPLVQETRERATRAAEVELDEYRQLVRQQRDELDDEIGRLTTRIEEATKTIDDASAQDERVEALRKRKELQAELDKKRTELDDLASQIEAGFPEKQREIRERHALTVRMRPVAATAISYERGDLELSVRTGESTVTRSYGYAVGAGVMKEVTCERCDRQLSAENPLTLDGDQVIGTVCCGE